MPAAITDNTPPAPAAAPTAAARWMTLGEVSRALEVNEATLRQWADRGRLPVYRTPGGHRRFLREDVEALMRGSSAADGAPAAGVAPGPVSEADDPEDLALRRIRSKLNRTADHSESEPAWLHSFRADGRDRMRLFGRRLLSLLLQNDRDAGGRNRNRRKDETLSETHMLGHEYGSEMADRNVPLTDSVRAFLFFRQAVVETVPPERLPQVVAMSDRVLVGLVSAYDNRRAANAAAAHDADAGDSQ